MSEFFCLLAGLIPLALLLTLAGFAILYRCGLLARYGLLPKEKP